ncbi:DoxX family membrane protein [Smaragdicoccus niigatensis]|uniref:DoxX family membrane protein n=1 Tax=Smaragdicoccus niigatensis TaxID=359359 RepID=UPI0003A40215|nr:DoxX family membrane protein [Smaragdicoccus niigatensis]
MLLRRIARPLLSAAFIAEGIDILQNPGPLADRLSPALDFTRRRSQHRADDGFVVAPSASGIEVNSPTTSDAVPNSFSSEHRLPTPPLPESPETAARIVAGVQIASAALFALGKAPRPAAALLATTTAVTLSQHAFWNEVDPELKKRERAQFLSGISKLGGVLIATADTEGQPSLGWRGRRAARDAKDHAEALAATAAAIAATARERGTNLVDTARERTSDFADTAKERLHVAEAPLDRRGRRAARKAQARAASLAETAREKGSALAETARERGPELVDAVRERGSDLAERARERSSEWADKARDEGPKIAEAAREHAHTAADIARAKADVARAKAREFRAEHS